MLAAGQDFGAFKLISPLSRGGMGEIWRASKVGPQGWQKEIVLKLILGQYASEAQFVNMFLSEARIAAQLDHPNIVPVFGFGSAEGSLYIEQELVKGRDLAKVVAENGALPAPLALYVVGEALKGLQYAHDARVMHRDLKPSNILCSDEGFVKLVDFGIARVVSEGEVAKTQMKGTAGYIAPELFDGSLPTPRSDLFAVGVILWEILAARDLFPGPTNAARLMAVYEGSVPRLADVGVAVDPGVQSVIDRLLARDPNARFASARAALEAILAAPGGRGMTSTDLRAFLASGSRTMIAGGAARGTPAATAGTAGAFDATVLAAGGRTALPSAAPAQSPPTALVGQQAPMTMGPRRRGGTQVGAPPATRNLVPIILLVVAVVIGVSVGLILRFTR